MAETREAAGRLALQGLIEVTQKGAVVDVATAKGPIRLRLRDDKRELAEGGKLAEDGKDE